MALTRVRSCTQWHQNGGGVHARGGSAKKAKATNTATDASVSAEKQEAEHESFCEELGIVLEPLPEFTVSIASDAQPLSTSAASTSHRKGPREISTKPPGKEKRDAWLDSTQTFCYCAETYVQERLPCGRNYF